MKFDFFDSPPVFYPLPPISLPPPFYVWKSERQRDPVAAARATSRTKAISLYLYLYLYNDNKLYSYSYS